MALTVHVFDTPGGRRLPLAEGTTIVGRAPDCAIRLDNADVSRHHVSLRVVDGRVWARDLGSRNASSLDDVVLEQETEWRPGQRLFVAGLPLELADSTGDRAGSPVAFPYLDEGRAVPLSELPLWDTQMQAGDDVGRIYHAMAAAGELLTRPRDLPEMTEPVLDLVERALRPQRIMLLLRGGPDNALMVHASRVHGETVSALPSLSTTLTRRVLEERTSFLIGDAMADPALRDQDSIIRAHVRTAMAVPLFDNAEVLGILYADRSDPVRAFQRDDLRILALLGNLIAMAFTQARLRQVESERQRLAEELVAARTVLAGIICAHPPTPTGWQVCPHLEPCTEVGGDFYDVHPCRHGGWGVLLGDVSGHGLGAALLVAQIIPVVRMLLDEHTDPVEILGLLNEHIFRTTAPHQFATVFLGILDPVTGDLAYANAGHVPPVLLTGAAQPRRLSAGGPPIGMLPELPLRGATCRIGAGDALLLCSDGVTECWDAAGEMFGETNVCEALTSCRCREAGALRDSLLAALARHRGNVPSDDDVALLILARG
jgi:phosphoserine phosphatase RsbU/P